MEKQSIVLYSMPIDELISIIRESVKSEIQNFKPPQTNDDELITSKEAAKILGISLVTLHHWKKDGKLNHYRIGSRVRFKKREMMDSLLSNRRYKR